MENKNMINTNAITHFCVYAADSDKEMAIVYFYDKEETVEIGVELSGSWFGEYFIIEDWKAEDDNPDYQRLIGEIELFLEDNHKEIESQIAEKIFDEYR